MKGLSIEPYGQIDGAGGFVSTFVLYVNAELADGGRLIKETSLRGYAFSKCPFGGYHGKTTVIKLQGDFTGKTQRFKGTTHLLDIARCRFITLEVIGFRKIKFRKISCFQLDIGHIM